MPGDADESPDQARIKRIVNLLAIRRLAGRNNLEPSSSVTTVPKGGISLLQGENTGKDSALI